MSHWFKQENKSNALLILKQRGKSSVVELRDKIIFFFQIWKSLKWYRRFIDVCEASYAHDEDFQGLFGLNWKWFKKETISIVCQTLCKNNDQM